MENGHSGDAAYIREVLGNDEHVMASATQRRWGPGGELTTPITLVATDKRLIVISRTKFGLKRDHEIVQYSNIVGAKLIHGFVSSSVAIRVRGYKITTKGASEEIHGFVTPAAKHLIDYVNMKIGSAPDQAAAQSNGHSDKNVYCTACGAVNLQGSKFCSACGKSL